jgi:hypothetical protein
VMLFHVSFCIRYKTHLDLRDNQGNLSLDGLLDTGGGDRRTAMVSGSVFLE